MRLAELSRRSGVASATIKYYLREGLLPQGRQVNATQAEYGEEHLRRLHLVRALIQVGRVPVARARQVLTAADTSLDLNERLDIAVQALPHDPSASGPDDACVRRARETVAELLAQERWQLGMELNDNFFAFRMLVAAVAALDRLGYACDVSQLTAYARQAAAIAAHDLDMVEKLAVTPEGEEAAAAFLILCEPLLLALRRIADSAESYRRFGPV
ncbi:MerR family transcriptional regulator [Streptomyces klenkii]|uniref:MerR family transcriptional regulator n=1 Tax=Streptomyces klenkii TaxID=1420899 RepID=UPI0034339EEE